MEIFVHLLVGVLQIDEIDRTSCALMFESILDRSGWRVIYRKFRDRL